MAARRAHSPFAAAAWIALAAAGGASCSSSGHGASDTGDGGSDCPTRSCPAPVGGSGSSGGAGASSGSSGSNGGASSGAGSSSGVATSSSGASPVGDSGACLGAAALAALGKSHMLIGGAIADATAAAAPFDLRYVYISGGLFDGSGPCTSCASSCTTGGGSQSCATGCSWWGCWQDDQDPPGDYVRGFVTGCQGASSPEIPMISYYQLLQSSGVAEGAAEVTQAATNQSFMTRYFADWRFLLKQIGQSPAILHVEPDFWGYAEQQNANPHMLSAKVASANATDCAGVENSIAGMGQCMVSMVRKYAPHALVGLHASAWSTAVDVTGNTSASLNVAAQAQATASFLSACGGSDADLVIVETSDRDAGYYQVVESQNVWWDATNTTLPDFHQDFAWVTALTEALGKPALFWQTPFGNENMPNAYINEGGSPVAGQWKDNRVDYFFGHMSELAAAHVIGAAFGAGASLQTDDTNDGGNFLAKARAYFNGGGQSLCTP